MTPSDLLLLGLYWYVYEFCFNAITLQFFAIPLSPVLISVSSPLHRNNFSLAISFSSQFLPSLRCLVATHTEKMALLNFLSSLQDGQGIWQRKHSISGHQQSRDTFQTFPILSWRDWIRHLHKWPLSCDRGGATKSLRICWHHPNNTQPHQLVPNVTSFRLGILKQQIIRCTSTRHRCGAISLLTLALSASDTTSLRDYSKWKFLATHQAISCSYHHSSYFGASENGYSFFSSFLGKNISLINHL